MRVYTRYFPVLLAGLLLTASCGPSDPTQKLLEERARWDARVLNWAQEPEGGINVSTQIKGPPTSPLRHFTVRLELVDANGDKVGEHWHTFDLEQVPRGAPKDLFIHIEDPGVPVEGLTLHRMPQPTPEEQGRIKELQP
jgi:hypothetical protein